MAWTLLTVGLIGIYWSAGAILYHWTYRAWLRWPYVPLAVGLVLFRKPMPRWETRL